MKGYLQRLAASAATSGGPIHPVLRPIFSAAMPESGVAPPDLDEVAAWSAPDPHRPSDVGASSQPVAARAPDVSAPPPVQEHAPAPTRNDLPPRSPAEQRRDNSDDARPASHHATPAPTRSAPRQSQDSPGSQAGADAAVPTQARQVSFERPFVPLLAPLSEPGDSAPAPVHRPLRAAVPGLPGSTRPDMASLTRASRRAATEPDEVQIHIGRIEVTAVQPAPARPAIAQPRRGAMSLDDYLKRRNGRAS